MTARTERLLVLDDDPAVVEFLAEQLTEKGFAAVAETDPLAALARIDAEEVDLVISDVQMPAMRGTDFLAAVLGKRPHQLVLLMSAFGSIDLAVSAVRAGACDFVAKPFTIESLVFAIERAFRDRSLRREVVRLRTTRSAASSGELIAESAAMRSVVDTARRAARSSATVLMTGETGTGKTAVARFIHSQSERKAKPFVHINCAALPPSLIEGELFGVRRGAFTDAKADRPGAFLSAADGTLFLDEIGELPMEVQAKLLHTLEAGTVRPLGASGEVATRARVIAATNRPLEVALREGAFRPDLYYRLNVIRIEVPPLRERRDDVLPLVDSFLAAASDRNSRAMVGVSAAAARKLLSYDWPGNVRELANLLERAVAMSDHDTILPEDLDLPRGPGPNRMLGTAPGTGLPLEAVERAYVRQVVDEHGGNKAQAARVLGINRRTLYRKLGE